MRNCHVCHQPWDAHAADCRIREDMARMRRTHARLTQEGGSDELVRRIGHYLDLFGELACQQADRLPSKAECASCGHGDICVIRPPEAA